MSSRRGSLICLLGVDGSGKTTAARELQRQLEEEGISCKYLNLDYSLFQRIPLRLRNRLGSPLIPLLKKKNSRRNATSVRRGLTSYISSPLLVITLLFHLFDALILYLLKVKPLISRTNVIHDRYFYDYPILYTDACPRWLMWCFRNVIPKPNLILLLDVSPEIALARDGDFKPDFYQRQQKRYLEFVHKLDDKMVYICNADSPVEEVNSAVYKRVWELIKGEKL